MSMRMKSVFAAALWLAPGAAVADTLTLDLPGKAERSTVTYSCKGVPPVTVEYINAGANALAIVNDGNATMVMVSVLSGSGARYAGRQYIWWTKGNSADFYDLTKGEDAAPVFSCQAG
jgi:membrane-bound inhibitor of C-type lysozyme